MKLRIIECASLSAKVPSTKALKKAKNILKADSKAKAASIKDKLQAQLDAASGLAKEIKSDAKMLEAQTNKLQAQIDKINDKAENIYLKKSGKLSGMMAKAVKMQDSYTKVGGKNLIPAELEDYVANKDKNKIKQKTRPSVSK